MKKFSFVNLFVLLLVSEYIQVSQANCPTRCTCSESKIKCIGGPGISLTQVFEEITPRRLPWVYTEQFNINTLTSSIVDAVIPWLDLGPLDNNGLSFQNSSISNIEDRTFVHLQQYRIKHFFLSYNKLAALRKHMFFGLQYVQDLDLSYNRIYSIPANTFSEMHSLGAVVLSHNSLTAIEPQTFRYNRLYLLSLTGNNLCSLNDNMLHPTYKLKHLSANNNSLEEIYFNGMQHLDTTNFNFNLDFNRLTSFDFTNFFLYNEDAPEHVEGMLYLRHNLIKEATFPNVCPTTPGHSHSMRINVHLENNSIPLTSLPSDEIFPCANTEIQHSLSGKLFVYLHQNCYCQTSSLKIGGMEIMTDSTEALCKNKDICNQQAIPSRICGVSPNKTSPTTTSSTVSTTRITSQTSTSTTKNIEVTVVGGKVKEEENMIFGLRSYLVIIICVAAAICLLIIVVTIAACCVKQRTKATKRRIDAASNNHQAEQGKDQRNQLPTISQGQRMNDSPLYQSSFEENPEDLHTTGYVGNPRSELSDADPSLVRKPSSNSAYTYMYMELDNVPKPPPYKPST